MPNIHSVTTIDFNNEGSEVEVKLLRALALGGSRSVEIQLLIDSQVGDKTDYQALALLLTDISIPEPRSRSTFERLRIHHERMRNEMGRFVGIKTAAMDYLENIERALKLRDEDQVLTYKQLAQMAFYDHLTGLANYRYFIGRFGEEIKRADRYQHLLSVIMLDLDFFKKFNDTHGHLAGNKVLEFVSDVLRSVVRETDLVARYGGEEFAVILPETTKVSAQELAERIRSRIESTAVEFQDESPQHITASLGVATYPRDACSAESLLASADEALYLSKNTGRNRVTLFTPANVAHFSYVPDPSQNVQMIHVIGNFNGWNKDVDVLQRASNGSFSLALQLAPGQYTYKFVINGAQYIDDPLSACFVQDGYGGRNSVMVVKEM